MSEQINIVVSEQMARRAEVLVRIRHQRVEDVLAELLEHAVEELPVDLLPDEDVLALAEMMVEDARQEELSDLLARNREGLLDVRCGTRGRVRSTRTIRPRRSRSPKRSKVCATSSRTSTGEHDQASSVSGSQP